jgi:alkaline phosphatase
MKKINKITFLLLVLCLVLNSAVFAGGKKDKRVAPEEEILKQISFEAPKHVFLFIGDGLGASQRQLGEYFLREQSGDEAAKLMMNTFPIAGMNTTYSEDSLVTDSAASATSLATGHKTNSKMIGQSPDGTALKTLVEAARDKGMATGVISNMRITHATPASFLAHNESRYNENDMAEDVLASGATFIAGGGFRHFVPQNGELKSKRKDDRNFVSEFEDAGYVTFLNDVEGFRSFSAEEEVKVFAPLTYSEMKYEVDRDPAKEPSLAEMTAKGIDVLEEDPDGFFFMVEGGKIDYASHANDPIGVVYDVLAFDDAVKEAYEFYLENPEDTLIIVLGDHETGGLGLGFKNDYFLDVDSLEAITGSADAMKYKGDREAFFNFIRNDNGLGEMSEEEIARVNAAMDMADAGTKPAHMSSYMSPVNASVSEIVSERANLFWTTYAHTGTTVPLTAIGAGSLNFGGQKDNTEVGMMIARLLDVTLD